MSFRFSRFVHTTLTTSSLTAMKPFTFQNKLVPKFCSQRRKSVFSYPNWYTANSMNLRGCADKYLARPGRKQSTATKLGIYSTYSPRSSTHSYPVALIFASHSTKIQKFVRPTRSPRQQWSPRRKKNGDLSIVFSVQGTGGSPTGPDPESRVGDQDTGSSGRPVSSGLQVPGEAGNCRARTRPPWWTSRGVILSKYPSIAPAEMSNTPC